MLQNFICFTFFNSTAGAYVSWKFFSNSLPPFMAAISSINLKTFWVVKKSFALFCEPTYLRSNRAKN